MTRPNAYFQLQPSKPVLHFGNLRRAIAARIFGSRLNRPTQSEQSRAANGNDRQKEPNQRTTPSSDSKLASFATRAESLAMTSDLPPSIILTSAAELVSNSSSTTSQSLPVRIGNASLNF